MLWRTVNSNGQCLRAAAHGSWQVWKDGNADMNNAAIVLAAGKGKRMQAKLPKQFLMLSGKPVIWYSLDCFQKSPLIRQIVLVTDEENVSFCEKEIVEKYGFSKVTKVTAGGAERYDSVYQGLLCCEGMDYVFIHDSARPFIDDRMLERGLASAMEHGAAIMAMPVKDTIKIADDKGFVKGTPDRKSLFMVQTPQIFSFPLIKDAYETMQRRGMEGITDDAMVLEKATGHPVHLVEGSYRNIKITTPEDMGIAELFMKFMIKSE